MWLGPLVKSGWLGSLGSQCGRGSQCGMGGRDGVCDWGSQGEQGVVKVVGRTDTIINQN